MRTWVVILLIAATVAAEPEVGEKEFDKGLKSVRSLMKRRKWKAAKKKLNALLEQHREKGHVCARLPQVRELSLECAFRAAHDDPDPKMLVQGELLKYEPRTGKIKIRFTPKTMKDWIKVGDLSIYPAPFAGPHSISIRGSSYPKDAIYLIVCWDGDRGVLVTPGLRGQTAQDGHTFAQIWHLRGEKRKRGSTLEPSKIMAEESFDVGIVVNSTRVTLYSDRTACVSGTKHPRHWGSGGIGGLTSFREIVVSGRCEKGWMDGLIDAENQKRRAEFKKTFKERDHLPAWLFAAGRKTKAGAKVATHDLWPAPLGDELKKTAEEIRVMLGGGKTKEALAATQAATTLPEVVRTYLTAEAQKRLGRFRKALASYEAVRSKASKFLPAIEGVAEMHAMLRDSAKAKTVYRELLDLYPDDPALHVN